MSSIYVPFEEEKKMRIITTFSKFELHFFLLLYKIYI